MLERHGIPFETLSASRKARAARCTALRIEDEFDEVYSRYEGRQIVRCAPAEEIELAAGSLVVALDGEAALRAALVLEPMSLYGVYQYPRFRPYTTDGMALPVLRLE